MIVKIQFTLQNDNGTLFSDQGHTLPNLKMEDVHWFEEKLIGMQQELLAISKQKSAGKK